MESPNNEEQKVEESKKTEEKKEENKEQELIDQIEENIEKLDIKAAEESLETVSKPKIGEEEGIENLVEENELLATDQTWDELGVKTEIKEALLEMNFVKPSKIQNTSYPLIMKEPYRHLIAQAKNGAGKTAAFGLGIVARVDENDQSVQAVVFEHTRELVNQTEGVLKKIAKNTKISVTGLTPDNKNTSIGQVVVITPGHFDTMFFKKKQINLDKLKILVLDEADYMITNETTVKVVDKTFKHFNEKKLKVQVLFFSATFTKKNFNFIKTYYKRANMIELKKEELTLKNVKQMFYYCKTAEDKVAFVEEYLKRNIEHERVIIFVNTRKFTVKLRETLVSKGYKVFILMGGDMDPKNRDETIKRFNKGEIQVLITTNVLARGYDEKLVNLVINFDLPVVVNSKQVACADHETYLHRIGRTGRFGAKGVGLTLITDNDKKHLKEIEKFYGTTIQEIKSLDELLEEFKKFLYEKY